MSCILVLLFDLIYDFFLLCLGHGFAHFRLNSLVFLPTNSFGVIRLGFPRVGSLLKTEQLYLSPTNSSMCVCLFCLPTLLLVLFVLDRCCFWFGLARFCFVLSVFFVLFWSLWFVLCCSACLMFCSCERCVWFDSVMFGSIRFGSVRFGSVRFGSVRFGSVRFGSVRFGSVRFGSFVSVPSFRLLPTFLSFCWCLYIRTKFTGRLTPLFRPPPPPSPLASIPPPPPNLPPPPHACLAQLGAGSSEGSLGIEPGQTEALTAISLGEGVNIVAPSSPGSQVTLRTIAPSPTPTPDKSQVRAKSEISLMGEGQGFTLNSCGVFLGGGEEALVWGEVEMIALPITRG